MKKKLSALLLTLAMCLGLAVPAFADTMSTEDWLKLSGGTHISGNWSYDLQEDGTAILRLSKVDGNNVIDGTMTLPATLDGHKVTAVDMNALRWNSPLRAKATFVNKLIIPEGYTSLGNYAFSADAIQEVSLPSTLVSVGDERFQDTQLKTVDLPASVSSLGRWCFGSRYLESVTIRNSELKINYAFAEKMSDDPLSSLKTIRCPAGSEAELYAMSKGIQVEHLDGGAPAASVFTDVPSTQYYYRPVLWAVENGITAGTTPTTFSPDQTCTRAQILTFLWRAAGSPYYGLCDQFTDVKDSDYFAQAVGWAFKAGILKPNYAGASETAFFPDEPCTRAAAVQFIWGAKDFHNYDALAHDFSFADVPADAEYYSAVVWAVYQGITSGTSATTFSPGQTCTRAQIMTFLYKAFEA